MAGSYPDAPSRRMAYDADGSVVLRWSGTSGLTTPLTAGEKSNVNSEASGLSGGLIGGPYGRGIVIFPELRDIYGVFIDNEVPTNEVEVSTDTTNGVDGSWSTVIADYADTLAGAGYVYYRTNIATSGFPASSKRAIRFEQNWNQGSGKAWYTLHIYGDIATGETPDRLLFIDTATGLEFTLPIDWGDVPRGTVHDRTLRIKNNSLILDAHAIVLSFEDLYLGSSAWYTIKETAGGFATTLGIDELLAGVTYPTAPALITVRQTVADDAPLGLHAARLKGVTGSWGFYATMTGTSTVTTSLSVS